MAVIQTDWMTRGGPGYAAEVERRSRLGEAGRRDFLSVPDVAAVLGLSETTVRGLIEEGRIAGVNVRSGRAGADGMPMKPMWVITRAALADFAGRVEAGV